MLAKAMSLVSFLLRHSWLIWVVALLLAATLVSIAYHIFLNWAPDTYWRAIAAALIEFALIVVLGAGFSQLLRASADARTAAEEERAKRLEFLRRVRTAHVQIVHSQKLMRVHASSRTYGEQHRELMRTSPILDEIFMDLREAMSLFADDQHTVTEAIRKLVEYLKAGEVEYERCHSAVTAAGSADHTKKISDMNGQGCDLTWTLDFADGGRGF
jgi:hypothetical protein